METWLWILLFIVFIALGFMAYSKGEKEKAAREAQERDIKQARRLEEELGRLIANGPGANFKRPEPILSEHRFACNVAGVNIGDRKRRTAKLREFYDDKDWDILLYLAREPSNANDPNAIKVMAEALQFTSDPDNDKTIKIGHIGYVPREIAAEAAPMMDMKRVMADFASISVFEVSADLTSVSAFEDEKGKTDITVKIEIIIKPR